MPPPKKSSAAGLLVYADNKHKNAARKASSSLSAYSSAHSYSSRGSAPYSTRTTQSAPEYSVGDCFQMTDDTTIQVECGKGPYQVYKVADSKSSCGDQGDFSRSGSVYCLKVDLRVHYCYKIPANGWIQPAPTCKASGTIVVFDVIPDTTSGDYCKSASNGTYYRYWFWRDPAQVVCAWTY